MSTGLIRPDSGQSAIDGQPYGRLPNPARVDAALPNTAATISPDDRYRPDSAPRRRLSVDGQLLLYSSWRRSQLIG
jgi:hypothetical protein